VGFLLVFRPQIETVKQLEAESGKRENLLFKSLHLRIVWLAAVFLLFYVGAEISMGSWGYSFLTIARSGSALFSAWVVSGYWCGLTLGRLTLANLTTRLGIWRLVGLCLFGTVFGLLLAWFLPGVGGAAIGFCLTGFFLGPLFPTTISLMSKALPVRLLATAIGFLASLGSGGGAIFPSLAGNLLQHIGFWFLPPFTLLLTICLLFVWLLLGKISSQIE
jgi:fucose permease